MNDIVTASGGCSSNDSGGGGGGGGGGIDTTGAGNADAVKKGKTMRVVSSRFLQAASEKAVKKPLVC